MKALHALFIIALLGVLACSENSSVLAPVEKSNSSVSQTDAEPNWLLNNPLINPDLSKKHIKKQLILANKNCEMKLEKKYKDYLGNKIIVKVKMKFKKGTLKQDCVIEMEVDDETGVLTFTPPQEFYKNAILTYELSGLDMNIVNPDDVRFVYLAENGTYEEVDYKKLEIKIKKGLLSIKLKDAKLPHFSRYGFLR